MTYPGLNKGQYLTHLDAQACHLVLGDGSKWDVYAGFQGILAQWQDGDTIGVKANRDPEYPYKLVNANRNESVEARLAGE